MKRPILVLLSLWHFATFAAPFQNEKPKCYTGKKSESNCNSYTEFKKKQKANKEKQNQKPVK